MLCDVFGRKITYMRISITDRCNFRCVYCAPLGGFTWKAHDAIMRYEEIAEVVRVAAENGINAVRITGGEPLVRPGVVDLVRLLASIPGINDLSLTTNAHLLADMAADLKEAGLNRVNISLDTLDEKKFARITRGGNLKKVLQGIKAAGDVGLTPIKINVVALKNINHDEFLSMARMSIEQNLHVRFIELMPINNQESWGEGFPTPAQAYISSSEILEILEPLELKALDGKSGNGPAREYQIKGALGTIGIISPVSEHFCFECNRLRLTADGNLRPCLMNDIEIPLLDSLRSGKPIFHLLQKAIEMKPVGHELSLNKQAEDRYMTEIGG